VPKARKATKGKFKKRRRIPPELEERILRYKNTPISTYELALLLGVPRTTIQAVFKRHGGRPPEVIEQIKAQKNEKIRGKTRGGGRDVERIYAETFRKYSGVAPKELQEELKRREIMLAEIDLKWKEQIAAHGRIKDKNLIRRRNRVVTEIKAIKAQLIWMNRKKG